MLRAPLPPPCHRTCPAGIDAPRYIRLIALGRFAEAAAVIREKVPFPLVLGYACSGPCEASCRCGLGRLPLAIRGLKRFAAERDIRPRTPPAPAAPPTGKRVAVVGSGPGGLTAAYYLARRGHDVTVFESEPEPGGMLRTGIPEFRLPRRVVDAEIEDIRRAGVRIRTGTPIRSRGDLFDAGHDAVLLAVGLPRSRRLDLPGTDLSGVHRGLAFLRAVNAGSPPAIGKDVVVLGGGNVAVDVARCATRLGARVELICLETRDSMPAFSWEITEAEEEGVRIRGGWGPERLHATGDAVSGIELRRCLSVLDPDGRFDPRFDARTTVSRACDTVVVAVGQAAGDDPLEGLGRGSEGLLRVDPVTLATSEPRVFACGDVVPGSASIIDAIAGGRRAAIAVDRQLGGTGEIDDERAAGADQDVPPQPGANGWESPRVAIPRLSVNERLDGFQPVELGFSEEMAMAEAQRCLRCDHVLRLDPEQCILCGKCEERCAFDAMAWRPSAPGVWRLVVRDGACQRCNDCVVCCPTHALRWEPWTDTDRLQAAPAAGGCSDASAGAA